MSGITFAAVVIGVIDAFMDQKRSFSAHDITDEVRDYNWHMTKIDPLETGTIFIKGKEVAVVTHSDVRSIVHRYFNEGHMDGYDRVNDKGYWWYSPATAVPDSDDPVAGPDYDGTSLL